ncbi:hypothetical protein [Acetobacterium tundrae]
MTEKSDAIVVIVSEETDHV